MFTSQRLFLVATAIFAQGAVHAATVYNTQAAFLANVAPGAYTEGFTGTAGSAASYSYSGGGFGYTVTAATTGGVASTVYNSGAFLGNNLPTEVLTVTFTSGNPTAVGGNFFITNISDVFQSAAVTLSLSDGTSITYTPASSAEYRGFTSLVPITSISMLAPGASQYNTMDNLTVGLATVVPEPATGLMMALGLGGLLVLRRRQPRC